MAIFLFSLKILTSAVRRQKSNDRVIIFIWFKKKSKFEPNFLRFQTLLRTTPFIQKIFQCELAEGHKHLIEDHELPLKNIQAKFRSEEL